MLHGRRSPLAMEEHVKGVSKEIDGRAAGRRSDSAGNVNGEVTVNGGATVKGGATVSDADESGRFVGRVTFLQLTKN